MPIYEYKCLECGEHLEKLQKSSDEPLTKCESCGGKMEKQWSLSGFQFKGEGWYVTDYAGKKSPDTTAATGKTSDGDSTDSGDSASKEKPEKKVEPKKESSTTAEKTD
jgi:putative FmdB family regulatory protein